MPRPRREGPRTDILFHQFGMIRFPAFPRNENVPAGAPELVAELLAIGHVRRIRGEGDAPIGVGFGGNGPFRGGIGPEGCEDGQGLDAAQGGGFTHRRVEAGRFRAAALLFRPALLQPGVMPDKHQRRAAAGLKTASLSMHMIFTGNPGTGKTTIARLVAKYLKAIGALKGGQLVEVTRADLVGRYTGHTAPLTNSVIESALGGVLFIDEAYSLYRGEQDSFGLEAIDTLVKGMEDHRDELVVILAGYTREMETFLTANSGLASRFPNRIEFPDYTAVELLQITHVQARNKGYRLAESCTEPLLGYYARWQAADARTAGNGRLARNTLEKAIFHQSRRLVAEPAAALDLILPSDLELKEP